MNANIKVSSISVFIMINHRCIAFKDKRLDNLTQELLAIHKNKDKRGLCIIKSVTYTDIRPPMDDKHTED